MLKVDNCRKPTTDVGQKYKPRRHLTLRMVGKDKSIPIEELDNLWFDVYEGYNKVGRYKLGTIKMKFS